MKVTLESILREVNEKTTQNNQYPVLTSSKNGISLQSDYFNKQVASRDNTGYKIIRRGQFTYRSMSDTGEFFPNMLECTDIGIVSPAYPVFEVINAAIIDKKYLQYFFKSLAFQRSISSFAQGSTRTSVKYGKMATVEVDLPSLEDQKKTVVCLEEVQRLLNRHHQIIAMLDDLVKARFVEMFGDPVSNPKGWPMPPIEDVVAGDRNALKAGPFGSALKKEYYVDAGYKIYGQEQVISGDPNYGDYYIDEERYKQLENCAVQAGDVLISLVGTYGKLLIMPNKFEPGIINPRLMKITFDKGKVNPYYFQHFFQSDSLKKALADNTHGGTMDILNLGIVRKIKMPLPPIELQNDFVAFVAQIDKSKSVVQKSLDETQVLFDSLMQEYFG